MHRSRFIRFDVLLMHRNSTRKLHSNGARFLCAECLAVRQFCSDGPHPARCRARAASSRRPRRRARQDHRRARAALRLVELRGICQTGVAVRAAGGAARMGLAPRRGHYAPRGSRARLHPAVRDQHRARYRQERGDVGALASLDLDVVATLSIPLRVLLAQLRGARRRPMPRRDRL
jgi:hypothetical protein